MATLSWKETRVHRLEPLSPFLLLQQKSIRFRTVRWQNRMLIFITDC